MTLEATTKLRSTVMILPRRVWTVNVVSSQPAKTPTASVVPPSGRCERTLTRLPTSSQPTVSRYSNLIFGPSAPALFDAPRVGAIHLPAASSKSNQLRGNLK